MPAGWALLGGVHASLRIGTFSYWMDSYSGGAIPAIGGTLVLGSLPRIMKSYRARDFLWLSIGMAILANSRPYEGLLVCVPVVVFMIWRFWRFPRPAGRVMFLRVLPAASVLVATLAFIGYYNYRVF